MIGSDRADARLADRARAPRNLCGLPAQNARRPGTATQWNNLMLAGDWTATGLPATIEGAIRSGNRAARFVDARD